MMNWKKIYDSESPALYSHLLARGCAPDLADDLVQEVFLAAMSSGSRIDRPRAYLFQAARNALARQRRRTPMTKEVTPVLEPESGADEAEAVNRALARLPVEQREVVVLRVWYDMSFRQIGEALSISTDTAASRWRYGISKLRSLLKKAGKSCEV